MKTLKETKSSKFMAIVVLALILSLNVSDAFAGDFIQKHRQYRHNRHNRGGQCGNTGNSVGAPLDGGIITILLGGAGVAYFARKRKKNNEQ